MEEQTLIIFKVLGGFVAVISLITGIFMPIVLAIMKRNAKSNDEKLSVLYTGQQTTIEAISEMKLKVNDTENKTRENYVNIKELKAVTREKFINLEDRIMRQGDLVLANKSGVEAVTILQKNCPSLKNHKS